MRMLVIGICLGLISCEEKGAVKVRYELHGKIGGLAVEVPEVAYSEVLETGAPFVEVIYDGENFEVWAGGICRHRGQSLAAATEFFVWAKNWMNAKGFLPQIVFTLPKTLRFESIGRLHRMMAQTGMVYGAYVVLTNGHGRETEIVRLRASWMSESRVDGPSIIPSITLQKSSSLSVGTSEDVLDFGTVCDECLKNLADYLVRVEGSLPISSGGIHRTNAHYIYIQIDSGAEYEAFAAVASVVAENGIELILVYDFDLD